jgi:putative (di)nucleoside polyphosphate hydrolase
MALRSANEGQMAEKSEYFRAGAGAVIVNRQGRVLALKRKDVSDSWQFPQGGLNQDEAPLEAALREVEEETGITRDHLRQLTNESPLLAYELPEKDRSRKTGRGQVHHWFLFRYEGPDEGITLGDGKEFDAWKWTSLPRVANQVVAFKRPVYRELLKRWGRRIEKMASDRSAV